MIKIWAKIYADKKIVRNLVYASDQPFRAEDLFLYLTEICELFDEPVPVVVGTHIRNFRDFNNVRIKREHFVEPVDFDYLQLENIG